MRNKHSNIIWGLIFFCLFLITACGGGSGGDATTYVVLAEPNLLLSETSYNFDGVVVNNSADRQFTITNNGTHDGLVINSISASSGTPFVITSENCTTQPAAGLAIGASCTFIVRFTPTAQGAQSGTISISSNNNPATITLDGFGYGMNVWINQIVSATCGSVVFDVTVTNPNDLLAKFNQANFTPTLGAITQGGVTQTITSFEPRDPDSVSAVLALDLSQSLTSAIGNIRTAAEYFVNKFKDGTVYPFVSDEAAIFKVADNITYFPTVGFQATTTAGKAGLVDYINDTSTDPPTTEGTALYDAVYASIERAKGGANSTKAVIVLSDGSDRGTPVHTLEQVITYANTDPKIPVFTIYYVDSDWAYDAKPAIMEQLAEETGGQDFYADVTSMQYIFDQIWGALTKKYRITYTPTSCTGSPLLQVDVGSGTLTGLDTKTIVFP